jgi:hypothetical protein
MVALCALLSSCFTSIGKWTYPSGRYATAQCEHPARAVVGVEPLLDVRSETNVSSMVWSYVPLSPCGWSHLDRPEVVISGVDTAQYRAEPCVDLARAIVTELDRERIVERAIFLPNGDRDASQTHLLRGKLRAFYVHETRWTYCLSVYGVALWFLGLPMATSENGFCVDLELLDAKDGRVVWQGSIFDADSHVEGLYYGPEWYRFSWMWERRLREKLGELATALGTEPAPLPQNLSDELRQAVATMPACLGVDSSRACTAR